MEFKVIKLTLPTNSKPPLPKIFFNSQTKKTIKSKSTLRFLKNKNIVEANKENCDQNFQYLTQKIDNDATSKISRKNSMNNFPRSVRTQRSSFGASDCKNLLPTGNQRSSIFSPQMKQEIIKRHEHQKRPSTRLTTANNSGNTTPMNDSKVIQITAREKHNLTKLLNKYDISADRCLMGRNIPKIQETYSFSRFQLFTLYTYYKTLLESSKNSVKQLKKGFESIMYINKIELNSEMIEQMFVEFFKEITFDNFMKVYGNIQNLLFTQNIIEYLITVFSEFYKEEYITGNQILQALKDKLDETESIEIKKLLFQFYNRREGDQKIQVRQILNACNQNPAICKRVFNGMKKEPTSKEVGKEGGQKK